jgi:hypothetical protein
VGITWHGWLLITGGQYGNHRGNEESHRPLRPSAGRLVYGIGSARPSRDPPETGGPDRHTTWLTTINTDGSPHVTGVGALWVEGTFWFVTGESTRKGRNLSRDPALHAVSTHDSDLVLEGDANKSPILRPLLQWLNVGLRGAGRAEWTRRVGALAAEYSALSTST